MTQCQRHVVYKRSSTNALVLCASAAEFRRCALLTRHVCRRGNNDLGLLRHHGLLHHHHLHLRRRNFREGLLGETAGAAFERVQVLRYKPVAPVAVAVRHAWICRRTRTRSQHVPVVARSAASLEQHRAGENWSRTAPHESARRIAATWRTNLDSDLHAAAALADFQEARAALGCVLPGHLF
jgi:hypothetical protein